MKIGNYDLNLDMSGWAGKIVSGLFWGVLVIALVGVGIWLLYKYIKNKTSYATPITLTYIFENGTQKDNVNLKGGKFVNKSGVWDFRIKIPKQIRTKELGYTPDFGKADSDKRICFITSGDGTLWQQYEKRIIAFEYKTINGRRFKHQLIIKPVPSDIKQATVNAIKNWRETIDKQKLTAFGIAIGAFIIMVIAHLISLYVQTKIKCGAP